MNLRLAILALVGALAVAVVSVAAYLAVSDTTAPTASTPPVTATNSPAPAPTRATPTTVTTTTTPALSAAQQQVQDQAQAAGVVGAERAYETVVTACDEAQNPNVGDVKIPSVESLDAYVSKHSELLPLLQLGFPIMCPEHVPTLDRVARGDVPFGSGTLEVGSGPEQIKPGTYRTTRSVNDCYWERTRPNGDIIENKFVTHATSITVTIKAGDGSFTNNRCGTWDRVR